MWACSKASAQSSVSDTMIQDLFWYNDKVSTQLHKTTWVSGMTKHMARKAKYILLRQCLSLSLAHFRDLLENQGRRWKHIQYTVSYKISSEDSWGNKTFDLVQPSNSAHLLNKWGIKERSDLLSIKLSPWKIMFRNNAGLPITWDVMLQSPSQTM